MPQAASTAFTFWARREVHVLPGVAEDGVLPPGAVGHAACVPKVDQALPGQHLLQLLYSGQATQAGIEHPYGTVIHGSRPLSLAGPLQGQLDELIQQLPVGEAHSHPQLGVHADGGEPRQGV